MKNDKTTTTAAVSAAEVALATAKEWAARAVKAAEAHLAGWLDAH